MEPTQNTQQEIYRLVKENNRMLHAMRRNAFWGGLIKFIIYAALLLAPIWLYLQYLAPVVNEALKTMQQIQGTGAKAQTQFGDFSTMLKEFQSKLQSTK